MRISGVATGPELRTARYGARQRDAGVCVAHQELQRLRSDGFRKSLRAQIGADCVGIVDDGGTTSLVPPDGQGQAEREDEPDKSEQRGLEAPKGSRRCSDRW